VSPPRLSANAVRALGAGHLLADPQPSRRRTPPIRPPAPPRTKAIDATRVLGLDLAARTTGYAMLVGGAVVDHGAFTLPDRAKGETTAHWMERRAAELGRQVDLLVSRHRPEVVGFEVIDETRPAWSGGSKGREMVVSQALGRAQGALVAQWARIGGGSRLVAVPVSTAKRLATGRVNASKDQVAYGLRVMRGYDLAGWSDDAVDALAIALAAREDGIG
jgi:Holliday junction resolvasome RuvABC endonuclease subunit